MRRVPGTGGPGRLPQLWPRVLLPAVLPAAAHLPAVPAADRPAPAPLPQQLSGRRPGPASVSQRLWARCSVEGGRAGGGAAVPPQHWEMSAGRASGGQGRPPPQPRLSCLALCTSSPRAGRSSAQSRNVSEPTPACPPPVSPGASGEPGGVQGPGRGQAQATPLVKAGGEPLPSARVPAPPSLAVETRPQGGAPRGSQSGAAACYPPAGIPLAIPDEGAEALQGAQRPRSLPTPGLRQLCRLCTAQLQESCTLHSPWRRMFINPVSGRWLSQ